MDHLQRRPRRRTAVVTTDSPQQEQHQDEDIEIVPSPSTFREPLLGLSKRVSASLLPLALHPFLSLLSESESETVPSRVARHGGSALLRRLSLGLLGAVHAVAVLVAALALAVLIGVGLVRFWVEEPVVLRQPLHFDYTNAHPSALVSFGSVVGVKGRAIPRGHITRVSLVLLMPDSDYNRLLGVFQVSAEVIASNGEIITSSSKPCMLKFRSLPVRLMRTLIMSIPLLVGMCSESQKIEFEVLRYKEITHKPTEGIRVQLKPRAGTYELPQIYEAELLMNSQLPRRKEIVYNWKWTFYVWVSLYVYIMLLIVLVCCFNPFGFPRRSNSYQVDQNAQVGKDDERSIEDRELSDEFSDALRRWRERSRSRRKVPELIEEPASIIAAGGETNEVIDDYGEFAASESSECVGG